MSTRPQKLSRADQTRRAAEEIGGELLAGSGFEDETPEEGFSGAIELPSTFLRLGRDS